TVSGKYPKAYDYFHGARLTEGVTEVKFSGGNLPDAYYDEVVFAGFIAGNLEAGKMRDFPVGQECEQGVHPWIEIPAAGKWPGTGGGGEPGLAPARKLLPKL